MRTSQLVPVGGVCPECGASNGFILAEDFTQYTSVEFVGGRFVKRESSMVEGGEPDSLRFYCLCGTYFKVPEELK